ncbi:Hsp70 family chaperone [Apiospora kogelbergensis]|uniref:Hsp70 family chaperone n=1 Tax=Apiospora kogelbergensis TaxID=1337665 RepID=UPI003131F50F
MDSRRPDIIVAVDLGTTYTGVAWARPQKNHALQTPIQVIHDWPGVATRNEQKVHTALVYNSDKSLSSWGPLCEDDDWNKERCEFFKIFLDKPTLDAAHQVGISQAPSSVRDAQKLVSDFLRQVYSHVKYTVELHTGISHIGWASLAVEFVFSAPTTWRSQQTINNFKEAIRDSGFGVEGPRHSATVELTESEAAAVGTIKGTTVNFRKDDVFLSIDAGGGTTDFALMRVVEEREPFPLLSQITQVDGIGIGASLIDQAFVSLINSRFSQFPDLVDILPHDCAERLVKSERFRITKYKFGEHVYKSSMYKLPLEGVPFDFDHQSARIESGKVVLSWSDLSSLSTHMTSWLTYIRGEIQSLFDPHIDRILEKIHEQLEWLQLNKITKPMSYMILSGGLGSSKYVRDRLQEYLVAKPHPYARNVKILQAMEPQLVVVKGLLLDRMQRLESGSVPVIVSRIARSSYGVVCKTRYDPNIHVNEVVVKDPMDGERYAIGQIDWLIKKGDSVNTTKAITATFTRKVDPEGARCWDVNIYTVNHGAATLLCTVRSNLTNVNDNELIMKRKARRLLFIKGKKYYTCCFDVHAIVAPADLRFELWFAGKKFSGNHEPIKVTWNEEGTNVRF